MKSDFLKLNLRDFMRGMLVAVISAAVGVLYAATQKDFTLTWEYWQPVFVETIRISIQAFIGYIFLNLFTNKTGGYNRLDG